MFDDNEEAVPLSVGGTAWIVLDVGSSVDVVGKGDEEDGPEFLKLESFCEWDACSLLEPPPDKVRVDSDEIATDGAITVVGVDWKLLLAWKVKHHGQRVLLK